MSEVEGLLALRPSPELIEAIAQRVADILEERGTVERVPASELVTIPEAADFLRCKRQRVDDLLSAGRLTARGSQLSSHPALSRRGSE